MDLHWVYTVVVGGPNCLHHSHAEIPSSRPHADTPMAGKEELADAYDLQEQLLPRLLRVEETSGNVAASDRMVLQRQPEPLLHQAFLHP